MKQELDLLKKAARGDETAFVQVYRLYQPYIWAKAKQYFKDFSTCQDLCQKVWLRVTEFWAKKLEVPAFPKAWFNTITVNVCIDHLRKLDNRIEKIPISQIEVENLSTHHDSEDERLLKVRLKKIILNQLTAKEVEIMIMRYWQGKKYNEIAEALSLTRDQVKYLLQKALRTIKQALKSN